MKYKLSATETAGVVGVGVVLGIISNQATGRVAPAQHAMAMIASSAALYTLGVVIGTNRPEGGWMDGAGTKQIESTPAPELAGLF
jgi:hypothetical protein